MQKEAEPEEKRLAVKTVKWERLGEGEEDEGRGLHRVAAAANLGVEPASAWSPPGPDRLGSRGSGEPWVR